MRRVSQHLCSHERMVKTGEGDLWLEGLLAGSDRLEHEGQRSCAVPLCQQLADHLGGRLHDELVLVGVYSLLELLQLLSFPALDLPGHDGLAPVDLGDHVVDHDAGAVVLEFARLEVLVCSLDRAGSVELSCWEEGCVSKGYPAWSEGDMAVADMDAGVYRVKTVWRTRRALTW